MADAVEYRTTECPQCGSDAINGAICRDCDIDLALGQCWQCKRQVERFTFHPTLFELLGTATPEPVEPQGHAPDCHVGKAEARERDRIVAWLTEKSKGEARFLTEADVAWRAAAEAIRRGEHLR